MRGIDIVAASTRPAELVRAFPDVAPGVAEVVAAADAKVTLRLAEGIRADLRVVSEEEFPAALLHFTEEREKRGWRNRRFFEFTHRFAST